MNRIQLRPGLHFWLKGREYVIKQRLTGGEFLLIEVVTQVSSQIKETALIQFLFRGEVEFEPPLATGWEGKNRDYLSSDFSQIPESLRDSAKRKYRYISGALDLPQRTQASLQPVIEQVARSCSDPNPPSWLTLYRWLKTYEAAGRDIRSLVPRHLSKGNYRPKLQKEVIQIIDQAIQSVYLTPERPDIADVYDEVLHHIIQENQTRAVIGTDSLKIPHRSTIYRAVSNVEPSLLAIGRYGKRIAAQMYDPVQRGPHPTRTLSRVEIDHTKLPLFVVDTEHRMPIGTPWLTVAVDKYSGVTLGYYASFEPPSYLSVMQCLLHAICPKNYLHSQYRSVENTWDTYGLPEVIVVDNGKEFYSTHLEDACLQLGIAIQYSPPKMPWYKSAIERYFGALNSQLLSHQPGKSFSYFLQPDDYDPKKNAVIDFEALQEILHIFIVDIHNQSSHPEQKSPRSLVWSKAIAEFPPALPPKTQELKVWLGRITTRKITRSGVEFEGLLYNSSELARLRSSVQKSEKTTVKYDPTDLSRIYVFDPTNHQFLEVPALNQEYTLGLTFWQHQVVKQLARSESEKVDMVALALAKQKIQQIVEREWKTSKKGRTRTTMARWLGVGRDGLSQSDSSQNQSCQVSVNNGNQSSLIAGLSDIGSTFNLNHPQSEALPSPDPREKPLKRSSRRSSGSRDQKNREPTQTDEVDSSTAVWQPDLSQWDVSIGLPTSPSEVKPYADK